MTAPLMDILRKKPSDLSMTVFGHVQFFVNKFDIFEKTIFFSDKFQYV
jgi:hypothetical protein